MPAGTYAEKFMLQYLLQGGTATRATAWTVGLSGGVPSSTSASEIAGYTRQVVGFASSNATLYTNTAGVAFAAFGTSTQLSGVLIFDQGGNYLCGGTLSANSTVRAGTDSATFTSGAIRVSLA